jgi:hypothetical protein
VKTFWGAFFAFLEFEKGQLQRDGRMLLKNILFCYLVQNDWQAMILALGLERV